MCIKVDIEQGSPEWKELRRNKIGASDAAAILGISPWTTPRQLYDQKINGEEVSVNWAMKQGLALEPIAREMFCNAMGKTFTPAVFVDKWTPWQMASVDGISSDWNEFIEIKAPNREVHENNKKGLIPSFYEAQMNHTFAVTDADLGFFVTIYEGEIAWTSRVKDREAAIELTDKEEEFWKKLQAREMPDLIAKDYQPWEHERGNELLAEYFHLSDISRDTDRRKKMIKEELIEIGPQRNFTLNGTKIYQTQNTSYDFTKMKEDGINLDKYRKMSSPYWMITPPRGRDKVST